MSALNRFLGDTPLRVFLKLVLVSFCVGLVMNFFGWSPYDVLYGVRDFFYRLYDMGFAAFGRFADYLILGAAVVVPGFLILRLLSYRK